MTQTSSPTPAWIVDRAGERGEVLGEAAGGGAHLLVRFAGRSPLQVPRDLLQSRPDGTLELPVTHDALTDDGHVVVARAREEAVIGTRCVDTARVVLHKRVREREAQLEAALREETVEVERVAIDRFVSEAPALRELDDGTLVVPCVQEVLVVEKRLLLKEELHIRRVERTRRVSRRVPLREELLELERVPLRDAPQRADEGDAAPHHER